VSRSFLSALDETQDKVKAFVAGGVDYVTKPFQPEEVMARVQTHLALRELQIKLEAIVAERTKELREAYAKLEAVSQARTTFFAEATRGLLALLMSIQQYQATNPAERNDLGDDQAMFAKSVSYLQVVVSDMIAQTEQATSRDFPA
jgi:DNA-binding response OmpR family regulator